MTALLIFPLPSPPLELAVLLGTSVLESVIRQQESGSLEFLSSFGFAASVYNEELNSQPEGICASVVIDIEQVCITEQRYTVQRLCI